MRDKVQLTKQLVAQLPQEFAVDIETAKLTWWYNIRAKGGMRLTALGFRTLARDIGLEYYTHEIKDPLNFTQKTILALDRKLQMPYYISVAKNKVPQALVFFSSKESVWLNLYGDLDRFLENYK